MKTHRLNAPHTLWFQHISVTHIAVHLPSLSPCVTYFNKWLVSPLMHVLQKISPLPPTWHGDYSNLRGNCPCKDWWEIPLFQPAVSLLLLFEPESYFSLDGHEAVTDMTGQLQINCVRALVQTLLHASLHRKISMMFKSIKCLLSKKVIIGHLWFMFFYHTGHLDSETLLKLQNTHYISQSVLALHQADYD